MHTYETFAFFAHAKLCKTAVPQEFRSAKLYKTSTFAKILRNYVKLYETM